MIDLHDLAAAEIVGVLRAVDAHSRSVPRGFRLRSPGDRRAVGDGACAVRNAAPTSRIVRAKMVWIRQGESPFATRNELESSTDVGFGTAGAEGTEKEGMQSRKLTVATMGPALAVAITGAVAVAPAAGDDDEREAEAIVTGYLQDVPK